MKVAYISSNLTQSISLKSPSHLSKSSLHPCSFIMFCCCLIFNVFTLSSTEVWANLNAAILFYSRHNCVTSIQRTNYSYLKVISTGNYSKYLKNLRSAVSVLKLWNAEMSRRSVSYIAEYQFSPDGHRDISGSRVPCLNQWKCDILVRWKTNVHSVLFLNSKNPTKFNWFSLTKQRWVFSYLKSTLKGNVNVGQSAVSFFVYVCRTNAFVCLRLGNPSERTDKVYDYLTWSNTCSDRSKSGIIRFIYRLRK